MKCLLKKHKYPASGKKGGKRQTGYSWNCSNFPRNCNQNIESSLPPFILLITIQMPWILRTVIPQTITEQNNVTLKSTIKKQCDNIFSRKATRNHHSYNYLRNSTRSSYQSYKEHKTEFRIWKAKRWICTWKRMEREGEKEREELQRYGASRSRHPFADLCSFLEEEDLVGISWEGNWEGSKMAEF